VKIAKVQRVRLGAAEALVEVLVDLELAPLFTELVGQGLTVVALVDDEGRPAGAMLKLTDLTLVARPVPIADQPTTRIEASDDPNNDPR